MGISTQRSEDTADICALECVCNLHPEETETEVYKLSKAKISFLHYWLSFSETKIAKRSKTHTRAGTNGREKADEWKNVSDERNELFGEMSNSF